MGSYSRKNLPPIIKRAANAEQVRLDSSATPSQESQRRHGHDDRREREWHNILRVVEELDPE
jgi:hypothetical protein